MAIWTRTRYVNPIRPQDDDDNTDTMICSFLVGLVVGALIILTIWWRNM